MKRTTLLFLLLLTPGVFLPTEMAYADGPSQKKLMELVALTSVVTLVGIGFTLITGALLTLQAFLSLTFSGIIDRALKITSQKTFKLAFLGVINTLGMAFLTILMGSLQQPITNLIGLAILLTFLSIFLLSLSSASITLGKRLLAGTSLEAHKTFCLAVGWLALAFCLLIPLVGWLIFLYYSLAALGSTMLALFQEEKKEEGEQGHLNV